MRLNIYSVEFHTRSIIGKDSEGNLIHGAPSKTSRELVAAESQGDAVEAVNDFAGSPNLVVEIQGVANHHQNVLIAGSEDGKAEEKTKKRGRNPRSVASQQTEKVQ